MCVQLLQADDEAIDKLIELLASDDWVTQDEAMESLLAMGAKAHATLQKAVKAGIMPYAVHAARVLHQQYAPHIFQFMRWLVVSKNPLLGEIAVDYVTRYGRYDAVGILLTCLPDCSYLVQISIARMMGILRATDAVDVLIKLVDVSYGSTLRMTAVSALGRIGDKRTLVVVCGLINDSDPHVSRMARLAAAMIEAGECICVRHLGFCDCLGVDRENIPHDDPAKPNR